VEYHQLVVFVLALIGAGIACRRIRATKPMFKVIDLLVVWVLFPVVIFNAIVKQERVFGSPVILACFGLAASAVFSALAITRAHMEKKRGAALALNACFMNYGYLGFPLAALLFGGEGLAIAAVYGVVIGIFHLTVGAAFAVGAAGKKVKSRLVAGELLAFPPVFAMLVALGLVVSLGSPLLPTEISQPLETLTLPLFVCFLLLVGYDMQFVNPRRYWRELSVAGVVRFVACPIVTYLGAVLMGVDPIRDRPVMQTAVLLSIMPPAMFNIVLARRFKLDLGLTSAMIFYLTLVSLFAVIPLVTFLIR